MDRPRRGLCFDEMSLGTVVLDEQDGYSRGACLAQQNRDIRQNTILQFRRHKPHQTNLNIDYHERGFQSAFSLSSPNCQKKNNCTATILLKTVGQATPKHRAGPVWGRLE